MAQADTDTGGKHGPRARHMARIASLDSLLGAHPDALRDHFRAGTATDSTELSGRLRGLILAIDPLSEAFVLTRPLVRALGGRILSWRGKTFESGGTAGVDELFGARVRFRCEVERSLIDDEQALVLSYDDLGNPWPLSTLRGELRDVSEGLAIGPVFASSAVGPRLWFWWGLATR